MAPSIAAQPFETVAGDRTQLIEPLRLVELIELGPRPLLQIGMHIAEVNARKDARCALVGERLDHCRYVAHTSFTGQPTLPGQT